MAPTAAVSSHLPPKTMRSTVPLHYGFVLIGRGVSPPGHPSVEGLDIGFLWLGMFIRPGEGSNYYSPVLYLSLITYNDPSSLDGGYPLGSPSSAH